MPAFQHTPDAHLKPSNLDWVDLQDHAVNAYDESMDEQQDMLRGVRDLVEALGKAPSQLEYQTLHATDTTLPTIGELVNQYGTWRAVCVKAGVKGGRNLHHEERANHTEQDLIDAMQACHAQVGDEFSQRRYNSWRAEHGYVAPSSGTIRRRMGGWYRASQIAKVPANGVSHEQPLRVQTPAKPLQLETHLPAAAAHAGVDLMQLSPTHYRTWREQMNVHAPGLTTVRDYLTGTCGSWQLGCQTIAAQQSTCIARDPSAVIHYKSALAAAWHRSQDEVLTALRYNEFRADDQLTALRIIEEAGSWDQALMICSMPTGRASVEQLIDGVRRALLFVQMPMLRETDYQLLRERQPHLELPDMQDIQRELGSLESACKVAARPRT